MSSLGIRAAGSAKGNTAKKAVILIMVLCFAGLSLTGCSSTPAGSDQEIPAGSNQEIPDSSGSEDSAGERIDAPVLITYSVNNPLTIEEHAESSGDQFNYAYITVSGMKDKGIEAAVNGRIKAVYDELRVQDLPPYRGVKTKIPEDAKLQNENINVEVTGNFNNILSIAFYKYANYMDTIPGVSEKSKGYYQYNESFSEIETLNLDLRTGEEIKLKDLFCDNVDYMELINDQISQFLSQNHADEEGYYMGMYSDIKLVEAFKGIDEDQRFAVHPYGISFVFDYRTPQFETGGMAVIPHFNYEQFGNTVAVTERYYEDEISIFASDAPAVKSLVARDAERDTGGNESLQDGNVNIYQSWGYSSDLPEEIRVKLEELKAVDQSKVDSLKQRYSTMTEAEISERGPGAYEIMVFGDRTGNYINVTKYSNLYLYDYFEQMMEFHCYDGETLEELMLEDLFTAGYDYKPVVLAAIKKAVNDYDGMQKDKSEVKYTDRQIEEIYSGIKGFRLWVDSVSIPIIHPDQVDQTYSLSLDIPYKDFGCDHMTIFR